LITLVEAGIKGGSSHKHFWTDDERDIVRRDYDGHKASAERIASKLSDMAGDTITFNAVKGQAAKMGILQNKSPDWTDLELEFLSEHIHEYSVVTIAKRLHRSVNAVKIKATRLKMGLRFRDGWYTKTEVAEIFGVDHHKVQKWIDTGALLAKWYTDRKPQQNGTAMWHISARALRDFIVNYNGELVGRNVDLFTIIHLLID